MVQPGVSLDPAYMKAEEYCSLPPLACPQLRLLCFPVGAEVQYGSFPSSLIRPFPRPRSHTCCWLLQSALLLVLAPVSVGEFCNPVWLSLSPFSVFTQSARCLEYHVSESTSLLQNLPQIQFSNDLVYLYFLADILYRHFLNYGYYLRSEAIFYELVLLLIYRYSEKYTQKRWLPLRKASGQVRNKRQTFPNIYLFVYFKLYIMPMSYPLQNNLIDQFLKAETLAFNFLSENYIDIPLPPPQICQNFIFHPSLLRNYAFLSIG